MNVGNVAGAGVSRVSLTVGRARYHSALLPLLLYDASLREKATS